MGTAYNTNVVSDGLMGCWDAANKRSYPGTGTTWTDIVGGNNATLINMEGEADSGFESQKMGVMAFDGTDAYANIGDVDALTDPTTATASVWFRLEGETASYGGILAAQFRWGFIYFNSGDELKSYAWLCTAMDGYTVTAGWHQAVTTWTASGGSNSASFYVDGILISQGQICYNMSVASELEIGRSDTLTPSQYFKGDITAIYIHDRVLTAAEVKQNYEATKSRFAPRIAKRGMNLNWDAGDPASYPGGTTWKDTAHGLTTTFHNMDASNFNSSNGGYFDFDGTDEWMTAPYSSLFQGDIADQGTFAAWFNIDEAEAGGSDVPIWCAGRNGSLLTWSMAQFNSSKKMHLGAYLGSWMAAATTDTVLSYDTWYYVVFTWDKANTQIKSYINGALDDTDTTSSTSITTSAAGELGIGGSLYSVSNGGTPGSFLNGFIGVLQLYNSVLSAAEVMDNYQKTKARFGH